MSITEKLMALGDWTVRLRPDTPQRIVDKIGFFSHVAVTETREDIRLAGDAVLGSARYVGVYQGQERSAEGLTLSGHGMAVWLGDADGKGAVIEDLTSFTAQSFSVVIPALLPDSVQPGTIHSVTGAFTGSFQYQTPRQAIDYVTSTMGAEWRVNGDGTLDAGEAEDLYPTEVRAGVFAKNRGTSSTVVALPGKATTAADVEDFTTRVVLLAQGTEASVATGSADIGVVPYLDLHGNPVQMTRLVSESGTSQTNADVRAQLQLNRFVNPRDALTLNSTTHDVAGEVRVGEYVYAYDPDAELFDLDNEIVFRGETLHPMVLRVTSLTWPLETGRGVYLRTQTGEWIDLTDHVLFESGQTNVTVGGYSRSLTGGGETVGTRPSPVIPNTTVPAAPVFVTPFRTVAYQSPLTGQTRAQVTVEWSQPLNTDGTVILDGDRYELRFRTTSQALLPATHQQMSLYSHDELNTHDSPIPFTTSAWEYRQVAWGTTATTLGDLTPGVPYEFQVRAIDNGTPANPSDWSTAALAQTPLDNVAPETPAAPFVAGNPLAVLVQHRLGSAAGGEFNLDLDLSHLEVHAAYTPLYEPVPLSPQDGGTLLGKLRATQAELTGSIPVTGSFSLTDPGEVFVRVVAVDATGNRSRPSAAVSASMTLTDSQYISELTASKISAGTITSQILNAGLIHTNASGVGADVGMDSDGFFAVDAEGDPYFEVTEAGAYVRGQIEAGEYGGRRIEVNPTLPAIRFWLDTTQQRYTLLPYSSDQPDDPADAPGIQLYGINEAGTAEGARMVLYEDGLILHLLDGAGGEQGGYLTADRGSVFMGYRDSGSTAGWRYQAGTDSFVIASNRTGTEGAYIVGSLNDLYLTVHNTSGTDRSQIRLDANGNDIQFKPQNGVGYITMRGNGFTQSSGLLRFIDGDGSGGLIRTWDDHRGIWFEFKDAGDSVYYGVRVGGFENLSDSRTKTNITTLNTSALSKIRGTRVTSFQRKAAGGGGAGESLADERLTPRKPVARSRRGRNKPGPFGKDRDAGVAAPVPQRKGVPVPPVLDAPVEIGLLADEAPPEIVSDPGNGGMKAINVGSQMGLLWKGVQELADENDGLRLKVTGLEQQVATLNSQVAWLFETLKIKPPKP